MPSDLERLYWQDIHEVAEHLVSLSIEWKKNMHTIKSDVGSAITRAEAKK